LIESGFATFGRFFDLITDATKKTECTYNGFRELVALESVLRKLQNDLRKQSSKGGRAIFIGNGGSAAIASHCAIDWTKNGGIRSIAFNDAAALTCWANDTGYENVFARQIEHHATKNDTVIIISSSGKSQNVLNAADSARTTGVHNIVTLTGMNPNNVLRQKGCVNLYIPSSDYGLVEMSHMALLHSLVSVR